MIDFVIDALACQRITRLIVEDTIFDRPRAHVKQSLHVAGYTKAIELLGCPWCVSVWVAFGVIAARRRFPRAWSPVAQALAAASVAGLASTVV